MEWIDIAKNEKNENVNMKMMLKRCGERWVSKKQFIMEKYL